VHYASHSRARSSGALLLAASLWSLGSCAAADGKDGPPLIGIEPLVSPARDGSGEPFLASTGDGVVLTWLEQIEGRRHALRIATLRGDEWSSPVTVAERDDFFVNWADFPSVAEVAPGVLAAHWLQRGGSGTYDYGVRVVRSTDGGATWSEPWMPHEDGTPTEHGFASFFPLENGAWGLVWLDGREFHAEDGAEASEEMTLRFRSVSADGTPGDEVLVDGRICDCCQTDATVTSAGPLVVYRDRTEDEIRDIYVTRMVDGAWTEGVPVHADGWNIGACPVNGPAASARGEAVVVAWFTGADEVPRVKVAFSDDAGATFSAPVQVDDGNPAGRVDVLMVDDRSALVVWLERRGDGQAEVRARRVWSDGEAGPAETIATSADARASGFPRMARAADGSLVFAWTEPGEDSARVRLARARVPE
jgi:hypothetical protein